MRPYFLLICLVALGSIAGDRATAQDDASHISVRVVLVELDIAVTDQKGNYVRGLKPEDFAIVEDEIPEKMATFEEGNETPRILLQHPSKDEPPVISAKGMGDSSAREIMK